MAVTEIDPQVGKDFIEHFGTRGMKWGVRRSREERAAGGGSEKKGASISAPKKVVGKTNTAKPASQLSDAQLKKAIERINMEQNFARLTAPPPTKTQKILTNVGRFAADVGKQVAAQEIKSVINNPQNSKIGKLLEAKKKKTALPKLNIPKAPNRFPTAAPTGPRFG